MFNRLLFISGLLCVLVAPDLHGQQLKVVAETQTFTDYEFINSELEILSPYEIKVPVRNGTPQFQVLEQAVSEIQVAIPAKKALGLALTDIEQPLIQPSETGNFRGRQISSISINIARAGQERAKVLRKLKLRVYKEGDAVAATAKKQLAEGDHPLSTGAWYKIPVTKNGIYELNSEYLTELEIDINTIDPRNIQLWGTNGYQLPEPNDEARPDFKQIPVIVQGESDGSFDGNDRVIFYGNSPHKVNITDDGYEHELHPYSDVKYVFLTIGQENGLRLNTSNSNLSPSRTITTFRDFIWKDEELYKSEERIRSGRYWLGQRFQPSSEGIETSILRDTIPGIIPDTEITLEGVIAGRSEQNMSFVLNFNGQDAGTYNILRLSNGYNASTGSSANTRTVSEEFNSSLANNGIIDVTATMFHNESNTTGFVDWLELSLTRTLTAENNRLYFYSPTDGAANEIGRYQLNGFASEPVVMEVSDPVNPQLLSATESGSAYEVNYYTGNDLQFIAQSQLSTPAAGSAVDNQNLHGISTYPDYIIITSEAFLDVAEDLAAYRQEKDGLSPVVVTQDQVLNEFSNGASDPTALRDYVKFLWDRAQASGNTLPKYLLFFGDTTFDYKGIIENSFTNHVLTYQTEESLSRLGSFATDDFFGFMDDDEGVIYRNGYSPFTHMVDIGVGRISAQTRQEALTAVEKIKIYENPQNTGEWQNLFTFAADDNFPDASDEDLHVINADGTARRMNIMEPGIRLKKVYEFAYPTEITGGGREVPGATQDFIRSINNGTLVINYSGHGNEQTLSDEDLFTSDLISTLTNKDKLTVFVTATCQFGRYDDIDAQSGAEKLVFAENGGAVATFTTTRVVVTSTNISSGNNYGLNVALSQAMLNRREGEVLRFGDIYMDMKNAALNGSIVVSTSNSKKFILIGDPAARFRVPERSAALTAINGTSTMDADTTLQIRALDQVQLQGQINDLSGNLINDYSGEATLTVFDTPRTVKLPDLDFVVNDNCSLQDCSYQVENDILFKGKVAVNNGIFNTEFIVPKDISFSDSTGRIITFANADGTTAGGSFDNVVFNGINPDAQDDGQGPDMNVYLNDERFVNGNLVNGSPNLIIELNDESGINTTGTGVGHEIIATIDTKPQQSFVLNDFYEGSINDFTRGRIEYPLDQIPDGSYTLKVRAWDVHNNPSEKEIFFEVASEEDLKVRNVYNFPNPMTNATRFAFEHNQPGNPLDVSVRIYTLSGKPVQHLKESLLTTSSYASISWDGRDRDYDRLGNGTYIYVLRVTTDTPKGRETAEKVEKLVIIR